MLPEHGPLGADLSAAGVEVLVRPLAVMRRSVMSPRGVRRVAAAWAADAGGLGRLARSRDVALVHTNTSTTLGGHIGGLIGGVLAALAFDQAERRRLPWLGFVLCALLAVAAVAGSLAIAGSPHDYTL